MSGRHARSDRLYSTRVEKLYNEYIIYISMTKLPIQLYIDISMTKLSLIAIQIGGAITL